MRRRSTTFAKTFKAIRRRSASAEPLARRVAFYSTRRVNGGAYHFRVRKTVHRTLMPMYIPNKTEPIPMANTHCRNPNWIEWCFTRKNEMRKLKNKMKACFKVTRSPSICWTALVRLSLRKESVQGGDGHQG